MREDTRPSAVLTVTRSGPLRGSCVVPGDKSISHRALIFGALADGTSDVANLGSGADVRATADALRALGVEIVARGRNASVRGAGFEGLAAPRAELDCGNSGTSMRLLAGLLAGRPFAGRLVGDASLGRRPMRRLADPLRRMGARVDGRRDPARPDELFAPLDLHGGALRGIDVSLPVASAQLKTALVLAGLQARGATTIIEPGPSRDHSERMLGALGAPVSARDGRVRVEPDGWRGRLRASSFAVPGDLSSAAFLLVAAALVPGSDVEVRGVGLNPTRTGVLDVLTAMGARLTVTPEREQGEQTGEPVGSVRMQYGPLRGARVDGVLALRALDEIPALAVAAARAQGVTTFGDLAELRVKESDRIAALARELGRAGVLVVETADGLVVHGGDASRAGGRVTSEGDHRVAMAMAVLGLVSEGETRVQAGDIATSFPELAATLRGLGAAPVF